MPQSLRSMLSSLVASCCTSVRAVRRLQVQKEAAAKEYANTRYDQPYQAALYETNVLLEARRWHTDEYEAVIDGLRAHELQVWATSPQLPVVSTRNSIPTAVRQALKAWGPRISSHNFGRG